MKCPYCVEENKKSRLLIPSGGTATAMAYQNYYDENGDFHSHDPNLYTKVLRCSKGHCWMISTQPECPSCDYGGEEKVRRLDNEHS